MLVVVPFQVFVSLQIIRRHVAISWTDIAEALWRSLVVAGTSAVGPALVLALVGFKSELPIWEVALALGLASVGWLAGLILTRHALLGEIRHTIRGLGLDRLIGRAVIKEMVKA